MGYVRTALVLLLVTALGTPPCGCATAVDRTYHADLDLLLAEGRRADAVTLIAEAGEAAYGERNRLLYHMDLALALQVAGDYRRSAAQFERADQLAADLYTRSLSSEAGSLFSSDLLIPYAGEEFERILVNVFNALNYLFLGEVNEALVEVRRIDAKFRSYGDVGEGRYRADGFALYLSGLLYEAAGELNDALIAYRNAWRTYAEGETFFGYGPSRTLAADVLRLSQALGIEVEPAIRELATAGAPDGRGEIVVLHYLGPGPRKVERIVEVNLGQGLNFAYAMDVRSEEQARVRQTLSVAKGLSSSTQVTIAYPVFEQPPRAATRARVRIPGCGEEHADLVEDISAIARINLEDRMARGWGRIVARAVLKFVTARAAGEVGEKVTDNPAVGLLARLITQGVLSATEAADIRGWRTLPAAVHLTRIACAPGTYDVSVIHDGGYRYDQQSFPSVKVDHGRKTFLLAATY